MNKDRRDRIAKIKEALEDLRGQIEDLQSEEREAFNSPNAVRLPKPPPTRCNRPMTPPTKRSRTLKPRPNNGR